MSTGTKVFGLLAVLIIGIVGFAILGYLMFWQAQNPGTTNTTSIQPTSAAVSTPAPVVAQAAINNIQAPINKEYSGKLNYNFRVYSSTAPVTPVKPIVNAPAPPRADNIKSIQIDAQSINAPVVHGVDGEAALYLGWWMYPASKDNGEKIILAHRRLWRPGHPYSAWNLNEVPAGSIIRVIDNQDNVYTYEIVSQSIRDGYDLSIFRPANDDDLIKVITCSTFDGAVGSSEYRYVTVAKRIS